MREFCSPSIGDVHFFEYMVFFVISQRFCESLPTLVDAGELFGSFLLNLVSIFVNLRNRRCDHSEFPPSDFFHRKYPHRRDAKPPSGAQLAFYEEYMRRGEL